MTDCRRFKYQNTGLLDHRLQHRRLTLNPPVGGWLGAGGGWPGVVGLSREGRTQLRRAGPGFGLLRVGGAGVRVVGCAGPSGSHS